MAVDCTVQYIIRFKPSISYLVWEVYANSNNEDGDRDWRSFDFVQQRIESEYYNCPKIGRGMCVSL